ncbi:hypothetical protein PPL_12525 [Heterostelium album PN500]|uniref:Uncharacterized protein n=1 Tax=Heterostelium pallidum (strain ATCC 26659 / Pp 5 / PN500) TaxID=670386 RepID=D3BMV2_HETP5|nr:hypothetical protein PPL_12525 [Heterostelium album PN500]EFA77314.1 hypothetical protein PPL_12525 [Heterostelium album PN500]|eukprot:XP_020429443.1 hypothetical protein PPL_12525 [Heterostelium album PN500]
MDILNATSSVDDDSTYTGSIATDRLMYSFWGIRILIYIFFLLVNIGQTFFELLVIMEKKNVNTRFFTYLSMSLFCACRVTGDILRYVNPHDYQVGSVYYFFFSFGVMQLLYTFFISDEVRLGAVKRVWIVSYSLVILYFCWQLPVEILCLYRDLTLLEAIGFFGFFILFASWVVFNGVTFVRGMRNSQKRNKMKHFDKIIRKTKILVSTAVVSVTIIILHDVLFNFVLDKPYKYFPLETSITMLVDVGQMIVVMVVMADRNSLKNYILFRRVRNIASKSGSTSLDTGSGVQSIDLSKKYEDSFRLDSESSSIARGDSYTFSASDSLRKVNGIELFKTQSTSSITPLVALPPKSETSSPNVSTTPPISSSVSTTPPSLSEPSTQIEMSATDSTTTVTPSEDNTPCNIAQSKHKYNIILSISMGVFNK